MCTATPFPRYVNFTYTINNALLVKVHNVVKRAYSFTFYLCIDIQHTSNDAPVADADVANK